MALQSLILDQGFDARGLLIPGYPALAALWGMTAAYLLTVLALLSRLGKDGSWEENFPRCGLSGAVMVLAGCLTAFVGVNQLLPGQMGYAVMTIAAGGAMALCGLLRWLGKKPLFLPELLIGVFYAVHLLHSYRDWNANPQVQRYAFQLLAGVAAMLFSIHRGRCAVGAMDRRELVFMGFAGIYLCFAALPGANDPVFFLASGLWCAGGMCELKRLTPPEPEELPAEDSPEV